MNTRPMSSRATAVACLLVLAACASPATSSPEQSMTESTPSVRESVAATPVPEGTVAELAISPGTLPPGRYTRSDFSPHVEFTLDSGWIAGSLLNGFFDVQQLSGTPDVMAVQFALPSSVSGADGGVTVTTARDAMDNLAADPDFVHLGEVEEVQVGGLDGLRLTIENQGSADAGVMHTPPGQLGISPERRLQVTFFDTDAGLLAMLVGGSVARWDETLRTVEPVVASVHIDQ